MKTSLSFILLSFCLSFASSEITVQEKEGEICVGVNRYLKTYKHEPFTIINGKDKLGSRLTFKVGPNCRIVFVSVCLWKCQ